MSAYLLRRFGRGLLVLWAAFTLTFFLLQVLPGGCGADQVSEPGPWPEPGANCGDAAGLRRR